MLLCAQVLCRGIGSSTLFSSYMLLIVYFVRATFKKLTWKVNANLSTTNTGCFFKPWNRFFLPRVPNICPFQNCGFRDRTSLKRPFGEFLRIQESNLETFDVPQLLSIHGSASSGTIRTARNFRVRDWTTQQWRHLQIIIEIYYEIQFLVCASCTTFRSGLNTQLCTWGKKRIFHRATVLVNP